MRGEEGVCSLLLLAVALSAGVVMLPVRAASPPELCDGRDNDADGSLDEGCERVCADRRLALAAAVADSQSNDSVRFGFDRGLVWDGSRFATAWLEDDSDGSQSVDPVIRLRRYDVSGHALEAPLVLAQLAPGQWSAEPTGPVLAWSGAGYGVVWDELIGGDMRVRFVHAGADGQPLAGPVSIDGAGFSDSAPAIAWDGGAFSVAWSRDRGQIWFARVASDGSVLVPETCISCAVPAGAERVSLAHRGDEIGFAWTATAAGVADGVRFARSGLDGILRGTVVDVASGSQGQDASLVATADGWAVSWSETASPGPGATALQFRRLDPAGAPAGASVRVDGGGTARLEEGSLVWTGEEYLVAWLAASSEIGFNWQLASREIDAAGTPLGAVTLHSAVQLVDRPRISAVWNGTELGLVIRHMIPDFVAWQAYLGLYGLRCCRDGDGDGVGWCDGDTDDGDATVHPSAPEVCDGRDNDLDGTLDEGCDRSCEAGPLLAAEDFGAQQDAVVSLATGGGEVFVAHADSGAPGVQLVLERGDAPWTREPVEQDPAVSAEPSTAWTGALAATVFRDGRESLPRLRATLRDGQGGAPVFDEPIAPAVQGTGDPWLEWDGLGLALSWREGAGGSLSFTRLLPSGSRLLDGLELSAGVGGASPQAAATPDPAGGVALALLEPVAGGIRVSFERRDRFGAARQPSGDPPPPRRTEVAPPLSGRRDPAVVATPAGYLVAWSGPEGSGGAREIMLAQLDGEGQPLSAPIPLSAGGGEADQPVLVWTGAEVVLVFRDRRDGGRARPFRVRLSESGARLGPDTPLGDDRDVDSLRARWDGRRVRIVWSRVAGSSWDVRAGGLDCVAPMAPSLVRRLRFTPTGELAWDPVEAAVYDVISGDLAALARGEGFAAAVDRCEADALAATQLLPAERTLPAFYLARATVGATAGSYAPDDGARTPDRDAGIAASAAACP